MSVLDKIDIVRVFKEEWKPTEKVWYAYVLKPGHSHREASTILIKEYPFCVSVYVWDGFRSHPHGYFFAGFDSAKANCAVELVKKIPYIAYWLPISSEAPSEVKYEEIEQFLENLKKFFRKKQGEIGVGDLIVIPDSDVVGEIVEVRPKDFLIRVFFLGREVYIRVDKKKVSYIARDLLI